MEKCCWPSCAFHTLTPSITLSLILASTLSLTLSPAPTLTLALTLNPDANADPHQTYHAVFPKYRATAPVMK